MYAQDALNRHPLEYEKDYRRCRFLRRKVRKHSLPIVDERKCSLDKRLELARHNDEETSSELFILNKGDELTLLHAWHSVEGGEGYGMEEIPVFPLWSGVRIRTA